jgi:hypothetical protein
MTVRRACFFFFASLLLPISSRTVRAATPPAVAASTPAAVLDATVAVLEKPDEASPVLLAERDLESDLQKVFGRAPRVIHSLQTGGGLVLVVDSHGPLGDDGSRRNPESFSLTLDTGLNAAPGWKAVVHLNGAGPRGAIYAIYTFSERYLGVDPMYYWTDREPAPRSSIDLPASFGNGVESPLFQYRGLFLNDEDLLTGWAPGEPGEGTGISLKVWDKVFETILRLKGNMVAPGSWPFPDDPQMKAASARGLILTQHHAMPLGVNVARWPKDVPYNYTSHPEVLERAWHNAVAAYAPGQEVLWSVGLRGLTDGPYSDPSVRGDDRALGALISRAIADQMAIVRERFPQAKFVTSLWREGASLVKAGYLHVPPEVTIVWADSGSGDLQDHGELKAGDGAYYHVAMVDGTSNQLSELVPVERIYSELGRFQDARATAYLLLNTSDIRPVIMTTRAVMDSAWSGVPKPDVTKPGGDSASDFYLRWAAQNYGKAAAPAIAPLYKLYFDAPAPNPRTGKPFGDQGYHAYARQMVLDAMIDVPTYFIPDQTPTWQAPVVSGGEYARTELPKLIETVLANCPAAQLRWDSLWTRAVEAEHLVPPDRRPSYEAQVLTMIAINQQSNRMLVALARSIQLGQAGQKQAALQSIHAAQDALVSLSQREHAAEYGKWKNWYRGDWLVGVPRTAEDLAAYERYLNDPMSPILPPLIWSSWEAYYRILHYEGDRTVDLRLP